MRVSYDNKFNNSACAVSAQLGLVLELLLAWRTAYVVLAGVAELSGGEVVGKRHPPEELDVRRVLVGVVRHALPKLHSVGQVRRAPLHVQRSPHLYIQYIVFYNTLFALTDRYIYTLAIIFIKSFLL